MDKKKRMKIFSYFSASFLQSIKDTLMKFNKYIL